ncbi:MAG: hypothetical protein R6V05_15495, partial [Candidatus Brocadiia bacterium]
MCIYHEGDGCYSAGPVTTMFRVLLIMVALVAGLCLGAVATHHWLLSRQPSAALLPGLRCSKPVRDLGRVWETDALGVQWRVRNASDADTFQIELKPSCACADVRPLSFSLGPAGEQVIEARLDLRPVVRWATDNPTFEEQVLLLGRMAGGESSRLTLVARGSVRRSYRLEPDGIDFGQVVQGHTPTRQVKVECLAPESVRDIDVISAPAAVEVTVAPTYDHQGRTHTLTARPAPDAPCAILRDTLRFRALLSSGPFVSYALPIRGAVVGHVYALPSFLQYGPVRPGQEAVQTVALRSRVGGSFQILDWETSADHVQV